MKKWRLSTIGIIAAKPILNGHSGKKLMAHVHRTSPKFGNSLPVRCHAASDAVIGDAATRGQQSGPLYADARRSAARNHANALVSPAPYRLLMQRAQRPLCDASAPTSLR